MNIHEDIEREAMGKYPVVNGLPIAHDVNMQISYSRAWRLRSGVAEKIGIAINVAMVLFG